MAAGAAGLRSCTCRSGHSGSVQDGGAHLPQSRQPAVYCLVPHYMRGELAGMPVLAVPALREMAHVVLAGARWSWAELHK